MLQFPLVISIIFCWCRCVCAHSCSQISSSCIGTVDVCIARDYLTFVLAVVVSIYV
jgi:hypothetical protein